MALKILEACIACDACVGECPTEAISEGDPIYLIDPALCTECVGFAEEPSCVQVCPVECIVFDHEEGDGSPKRER